jgi:hypothetical protein
VVPGRLCSAPCEGGAPFGTVQLAPRSSKPARLHGGAPQQAGAAACPTLAAYGVMLGAAPSTLRRFWSLNQRHQIEQHAYPAQPVTPTDLPSFFNRTTTTRLLPAAAATVNRQTPRRRKGPAAGQPHAGSLRGHRRRRAARQPEQAQHTDPTAEYSRVHRQLPPTLHRDAPHHQSSSINPGTVHRGGRRAAPTKHTKRMQPRQHTGTLSTGKPERDAATTTTTITTTTATRC